MRRLLGHIKSRSRGSFFIKIGLGRDVNGKYQYRWYTIRGSHKDAELKLSELLHDAKQGNITAPNQIKVREFLAQWLEEYARPKLGPEAFMRYESVIRIHINPSIGHLKLTALTPGHIRQLYTEKSKTKLKPRSIKYIHTVLHKALNTAASPEWSLLGRNVADKMTLPSPDDTPVEVWNEQEIKTFLAAAAQTAYYELFYMDLYTGIRRSELLALTWRDVDLQTGHAAVSKGLHQLRKNDNNAFIFRKNKSKKSKRSVALHPGTVELLKNYKLKRKMNAKILGLEFSENDLVFSKPDGSPIRPNSVTLAWTRTCLKAGVKVITLHDGRHTHASILLKQKVHPKIVQERLGHSDIGITMDLYSHMAPGMQEEAVKNLDNETPT